MTKNSALALLISCALHAAAFLSFKATPPRAREPEPRRVEIELRQVEARRGPPAGEKKTRGPSSRRPARVNVPVPVTAVADEGLPVLPVGPPADEGSGVEPGGFEGSGGEGSQPPPRPPDTRAEVLSLPRVEYPMEAREDGVEGVVRLRIQLDAQGRLISVEILEDPGSGLGETARLAMMKASFRAATHLGSNVESSFEYLYRFELE